MLPFCRDIKKVKDSRILPTDAASIAAFLWLCHANLSRAQSIRDLPPLSHSGRLIQGVMSRGTEAVENDT
jgi:hypothetical protein